MTPEQKKHEEEYFAAKKKYEMAYANKAKYSREKAGAETKRQQLINSINSKKSELKKVSQTYTDLPIFLNCVAAADKCFAAF